MSDLIRTFADTWPGLALLVFLAAVLMAGVVTVLDAARNAIARSWERW